MTDKDLEILDSIIDEIVNDLRQHIDNVFNKELELRLNNMKFDIINNIKMIDHNDS